MRRTQRVRNTYRGATPRRTMRTVARRTASQVDIEESLRQMHAVLAEAAATSEIEWPGSREMDIAHLELLAEDFGRHLRQREWQSAYETAMRLVERLNHAPSFVTHQLDQPFRHLVAALPPEQRERLYEGLREARHMEHGYPSAAMEN